MPATSARVSTRSILQKVWGLKFDQLKRSSIPTKAYTDYCKNLLHSNSKLAWTLRLTDDPSRISELVELVKARQLTDDIASVQAAIESTIGTWSNTALNNDRACEALKFVLKLWLFTDPSVQDPTRTISQVNRELLAVTSRSQTNGPAADVNWLSADFCAKTLTRKAGFYLVWTSDLAKHLEFASENQLQVFRHAAILQSYQNGPEGDLYPDGFLEETYQTIHLLFPFEDLDTCKRVRRITRKQHVDIKVDIEAVASMEKAMDEYAKLRVSNYRYYGPRLAEIQQRYNLARPRRLQQWWYDRRQRQEWGALMIALIVFVLTIFFGLISSVTGIMQVWASFQALSK